MAQVAQGRAEERFSCPVAKYELPTFWRPNYNKMREGNKALENSKTKPKHGHASAIQLWTNESPVYHEINKALLTDDPHLMAKHADVIYSLKVCLKEGGKQSALTVYRGLNLDDASCQDQYPVGTKFLWPTFSCSSKSASVAKGFGNWLFMIKTPGNGLSYFRDISKHSVYPSEQEVLFYPYSGFEVTAIDVKKRQISLTCLDTVAVDRYAKLLIPKTLRMVDSSRNLEVLIENNKFYLVDSKGNKHLIPENSEGYWDTPYRFHHKNGYIIKKANGKWTEVQSSATYNFVEKK